MFGFFLGYALARGLMPRTTAVALGDGEVATWYVPVERAMREWSSAMRESRFVAMGLRGKVVWVNPRAVLVMEGRR